MELIRIALRSAESRTTFAGAAAPEEPGSLTEPGRKVPVFVVVTGRE